MLYDTVLCSDNKFFALGILCIVHDTTFKKLAKQDVSEDEIKELEDQIQKLTDKYIKEVDKAIENKSKEILTV